ncbi:MAG: hypothetical protein JZU70_09165 [Chlorobium sp.]|nr:hypothetical protein [Chlorobium sp.]
MLPRIPFVEETRDFWSFSKAGRELANLHLDYETVPPSHPPRRSPALKLATSPSKKCASPKKGRKRPSSTTAPSPSRTSPPKPGNTPSTAKAPSNGSWNATNSPPTKRAPSPTTPTTGPKRSATLATFSTCC